MCSVEVGRCNNKESFGKPPCSLVIETGRLDHVGPHYCKTDHFCDQKCPRGCLEYCIKKLELKQNESTGQSAFRAHNGACTTSSHTFSNRTEKEFQETIKQLNLNAQKAVRTGAITIIKGAVTEHLHSFEAPKNTVSDVDAHLKGLRDAGLKLCDWSQEPVKRLTVSLSTAEFLIKAFDAEVLRECPPYIRRQLLKEHESSKISKFCLCEVIEGEVVVTHWLLDLVIAAFKG